LQKTSFTGELQLTPEMGNEQAKILLDSSFLRSWFNLLSAHPSAS